MIFTVGSQVDEEYNTEKNGLGYNWNISFDIAHALQFELELQTATVLPLGVGLHLYVPKRTPEVPVLYQHTSFFF